MTEALTKQPTLAELKVAARVLLEEDPSLTAARYALRMQEAKDLLDESIRQSNIGTKAYLDHLSSVQARRALHNDFANAWPITALTRHCRQGRV